MIRIDSLTVTYPEASSPALSVPRLRVKDGEFVLVSGPTGSGKSTLLKTLDGVVPHLTGGRLAGRVTVAGRDTAQHRPRDLAGIVGFVQQDPAASFVTDRVEDEIAYGMETVGVAPSVMRRRVEETLDLLDLTGLRHRPLGRLSGGQQQRVAIAAVLAAGPALLVLDEPTSALDPVAAEEVLSAIQRLVHDHGLTVVLAEHRLERVIHHVDGVVLVADGCAGDVLDPREAMATAAVLPPLVALGRYAGWQPLPLSVREGRRAAGELRRRLAALGPPAHPAGGNGEAHAPAWRGVGPTDSPPPAAPVPLDVGGLRVDRGGAAVLRGLDLRVGPGEIVALMGRNGSGKSTLLWTLVGQLPMAGGRVELGGRDLASYDDRTRVGAVGLVPQDPDDLLYAATIGEECADADHDAGVATGTCAGAFAALVGAVDAGRHPRDLSEGQRLGLALAVILASDPPLLLLDEPTRGLDYPAKTHLVEVLRRRAADGVAVVVATHDVELAAEVATRVVLLADGQVVADDAGADVLTQSTAYAPQIARVLHPVPVATLDEVRTRLGTAP